MTVALTVSAIETDTGDHRESTDAFVDERESASIGK